MRVPPRPPLNLERRPFTKPQAPKGAWIADVRAMTQGKLDTVPRPLPANATRLRVKLWERRQQEQEQRA